MFFNSGYYCPEGSQDQINCPRGQYCDDTGLDTPKNNCTEGFYCDYNSDVTDPVECSLGHYCPTGSEIEEACPPGTFQSMYQYKDMSMSLKLLYGTSQCTNIHCGYIKVYLQCIMLYSQCTVYILTNGNKLLVNTGENSDTLVNYCENIYTAIHV